MGFGSKGDLSVTKPRPKDRPVDACAFRSEPYYTTLATQLTQAVVHRPNAELQATSELFRRYDVDISDWFPSLAVNMMLTLMLRCA